MFPHPRMPGCESTLPRSLVNYHFNQVPYFEKILTLTYLQIKTSLFLGTRTWHWGKKKKPWLNEIIPTKSANQGIKYLHAYQLPWNNYLDGAYWLSSAAPGHPDTDLKPSVLTPDLPNVELRLGIDGKEKSHFLTMIFCLNKTDIFPKHS